MEDIVRIIFPNSDEKLTAENTLNASGEWFDYDSGDRMMLAQNGLFLLNEAEIDYDMV